jgi:type IV pilus assembly protein PilV
LIEVMIAVLIFSVGLIGLAGLLVMATRSNHAAYLRTQVTFLAGGMADRMRANPVGVWNGDYNANYPNSTTKSCSAGCSPTDVANHDQEMWSSQLKTFLPNPAATINCTNGSAGYAPTTDQLAMRPPYGGNCQMTIKWTERNEGDKNDRDAAPQTFAWEFQP